MMNVDASGHLFHAAWAAYNLRDAGAGAAAVPPAAPPPVAAPPPPPPPVAHPATPPPPLPAVASISLEDYVDLADALASPTSRRARRVRGLAPAMFQAASLRAALALHGCGTAKGGKQDLLDRAAGMRILHPTALADASPPDVDAGVAGVTGSDLRVTPADLVALAWAAPGAALDAGLSAAMEISVDVVEEEEPAAVAEQQAAASTPPPAKRARAPSPPPRPPAAPSVGDLVWVPLGAAWWPAEVEAVEMNEGGAASLRVIVLALNARLSVPAPTVKRIDDGFEARAAATEAGTAAGAQAVALARARLAQQAPAVEA